MVLPYGLLSQVQNNSKVVWRSSAASTKKLFSRAVVNNHNKPWWHQILDPKSEFVDQWNHFFLVVLLVALFLDPLYFFLPIVAAKSVCMDISISLSVTITLFRSVGDLFAFMHIALKFRTAYVAYGVNVVGRKELVTDPRKIAMRYLKSTFAIDFAAALPLPQIVIYGIIPSLPNSSAANANHTVSLVIFLQYIPRLCVMFPLNDKIVKTTGVVAKTAWSGAAYNILLYILTGHVLGASWYLLSIERQNSCWKLNCKKEFNSTHSPSCDLMYLDCKSVGQPDRAAWALSTQVIKECDAKGADSFEFGIFAKAFTENVAGVRFVEKYFYCLWWGMRQLCSFSQDLKPTIYAWEVMYCCLIPLVGLVLFATLIANVQTYLNSTTLRLEEWRVKQRDTEEWMKHRQLPEKLQERVRSFVQYKWLATRGVAEEDLLNDLPYDVRREIQKHLCLALVRRVPLFSQMDDQLLVAICERLVSSINTKDSYIVREDDPVNEMLFIIRGQLESSTTDGGRSGFFNSITLKPGDFCGEELLTWALMPNPSMTLPLSTRTVRCSTEVEAFALRAEDLKFVANQFKRLHSKKLQHAFRYYSHQWRTWGACFVQAAWRRYKRKKLAEELAKQEGYYIGYGDEDGYDDMDGDAAETTRMMHPKVTFGESDSSALVMPRKLFKPNEPNFSLN